MEQLFGEVKFLDFLDILSHGGIITSQCVFSKFSDFIHLLRLLASMYPCGARLAPPPSFLDFLLLLRFLVLLFLFHLPISTLSSWIFAHIFRQITTWKLFLHISTDFSCGVQLLKNKKRDFQNLHESEMRWNDAVCCWPESSFSPRQFCSFALLTSISKSTVGNQTLVSFFL